MRESETFYRTTPTIEIYQWDRCPLHRNCYNKHQSFFGNPSREISLGSLLTNLPSHGEWKLIEDRSHENEFHHFRDYNKN